MILCFILNVYWKFNFSELDEKIKNSFSMPIFTICYTQSCKKCKNIKNQYNDFISISGNRTDIYTLMINCLAHEDFCQYLGVKETPVSFLLIGNNSRYWPKSYSNQAEDWISFIDKYVNSNLKKIDVDDKKQLDSIIQKSADNGGVTYYLLAKNSRDEVLRQIRQYAYHYLIYNVSFVYSIDENIKKTEITRFYTIDYFEKFSGELVDVEKFIKEVQFGLIHKYDYKEWKELKSPKMVLFTNQNFILNSQKKGLIKIANKFRQQISVGWVSASDENSKQFFNDFPLNDLPIILIYDETKNSCYSIAKARTIDIVEIDFVKDFLNQKLVYNQTFDSNNVVNVKLNHSHVKSKTISGKLFLVIYVLSCLTAIGLLRLKTKDDEKEE